MISISRRQQTIHILAKEKLNDEAYKKIIPLLKQTLEQNESYNLIFQMENFKGEKPEASWHDLKFDLINFDKLKRIALVGEDRWKKTMKEIVRPFNDAEVNHFDEELVEMAKAWTSN